MRESTAASPEVLVDLQDLSKAFGEHLAVDHLSLQVTRGEVLALLGPNGAGKTTTIRMLMGILSPTAGTATVCGLDCFGERPRVMAHVGYLPDEPMFYDHLRGGEIVRFCGSMRGMPKREVETRTSELAERLQFADALDEYAVNYSMGMKKKLALACAMLHRPDVLVLDEPTNGLDPVVTRTLLQLVRELAEDGTAIFYSTHLLDQAQKLCDRVAILHQGKLAALGTPDALRSDLAAGGSLEDVFFEVADADRSVDGGAAGAGE